jgi:hypothetical protein
MALGRSGRQGNGHLWERQDLSRNLHGTPLSARERSCDYRQVSAPYRCGWIAVCKTVGLASIHGLNRWVFGRVDAKGAL